MDVECLGGGAHLLGVLPASSVHSPKGALTNQLQDMVILHLVSLWRLKGAWLNGCHSAH